MANYRHSSYICKKFSSMIQMVDLKSQYLKIKDEIDSGIARVINNTEFINGQDVKDFRKELATYLNVGNVITCGNGTDALQIAMMALGLKPGDEVISTDFTFIATVFQFAISANLVGYKSHNC